MSLTQAATEQQWESRQVKSVGLNEHRNEHNHRGLPSQQALSFYGGLFSKQ